MEVSTRELAEVFEVNFSTIANWYKEGMPREGVKTGRGGGAIYSTKRCIDWFTLREKKRYSLGDEEGTIYDVNVEKGRLTHHQANKEAMIEAQLRGELIAAGEVEKEWSAAVLAARAKMLSLPSKLAKVAINAESVKEIERLAYDLLEEALNELDIHESEIDSQEGDEADKVPAEVESE